MIFQLDIVDVFGISIVLSQWGFFIHCNIRLSFWIFTPLLVGPQVHRIHHSVLPQHTDKNFAAIFPILDIIFGTYVKPKKDEYPPTGLHSKEFPQELHDAHLMPFISWFS